MKFQVLIDNDTLHDDLKTEHGLSIYLETDRLKYLLDTGGSHLFIENAKAMEIDLTQIDYVFISHGHLDHIGGLLPFLKINSKAKVIISQNALQQSYFSVRNNKRSISTNDDFTPYFERFVFIDEFLQIENEVHVFKCNCKQFELPRANITLMKDVNGQIAHDDFNHELVFVYGNRHLFVYTGCAHSGVLNILNEIHQKINMPVKILIGGFHLIDGNYETKSEIEEIAKQLNENYPLTKFLTGHCTGVNAYHLLKQKLDIRLSFFYTGLTVIEPNT
jgi:7,8-dihydropterin-6-yl-methyl-4-(beta-D-ribofuranosyl)aminobenzene 5'-phosphate synthase